MNVNDNTEMSSLLERGDSEENIPLLDETYGKESCCSFKTSDENAVADLGSDQPSGTSLNKHAVLDVAFGNSEEDITSIKVPSTKEDEVKERDEEKDGINPVKAGEEEETKVKKISNKLVDGARIVESTKEEGPQNVSPLPEQAIIGDALPQGHVERERPVSGGGESGVATAPVLTILKPKAQNVSVDDEDIYRVQSEADKQSPNFFIRNIVTGRIDLGDHADMIDDLLYWRNPKKTALIFLSVLSVLIAVRYYSVISVMAYVSLGCLGCGFVGRVYGTSHGTPNPIMQLAPALSEENVRKFTDLTAYFVNDTILAIRRLYLADDLADSIKFGLVLWYLTYVGVWFNGMTIVTICFVTVFTLPNIYEYNKEAIDDKMAAVWGKWLNMTHGARNASQEHLKRLLTNEHHEKVK